MISVGDLAPAVAAAARARAERAEAQVAAAAAAASVGGEEPGRYIVTEKAAVTREAALKAGDVSSVAKVLAGAAVDVVEVVRLEAEQRIRGRLNKPRGWISLVDTQTGRRWAVRRPLCDRGHELERREAGRKGSCSACARPHEEGLLLLGCERCGHWRCAECGAEGAPAQAWTLQLNAGNEVEDLGFKHYPAPPARAVLSGLAPGSWAFEHGARAGDQLVAVNGRNVEHMSAEELDAALGLERPLGLLLAHSADSRGPEAPKPRPEIRLLEEEEEEVASQADSHVVLRMVAQNLDWATLSADPKLLAAFECALRRAVAVEADNGIEAEDVKLSYSTDPTVVIRCSMAPRRGASAQAVRLELGRSRSVGQTLTQAVSALECGGEVSLHNVRITEVAVEVDAAKPQLSEEGKPVPPHLWGVSKAQCAELLDQLRKDATWKSSNTVHALVSDVLVPMTRGTGRGYALCKNGGAPKEANVLVAHAWSANAEDLLECVLRSTSEDDVLFICALALYQAEDDAGPSVAEQLGPSHKQGPFQQVLEHIQAQGSAAGWRWRCRDLLQALALLPLVLALIVFYGPIVVWGCVPSLDMSRCAERAPPQAGEEAAAEEWVWQSTYELELAQAPAGFRSFWVVGYALSALLAILAALAAFASQTCRMYHGCLLVIPSRETELCGRLWCLAHIAAARAAGLPALWGRTLAGAGRCSAAAALCTNPSDRERLLRELEEEEGGLRRALGAVRSALRWRRWLLSCAVLRWALLASLLRCADLRLAMGGPVWDAAGDEPGLPALSLAGAVIGTLLYSAVIYGLARRSEGRPRRWAAVLCAGLLLVLGGGALAVLVHLKVLRSVALGAWTDAVPLLSAEGAAYLSREGCQEKLCQRAVSLVASLAQSLLAGGLGLAVLLPGALCCPRRLQRRRPLAVALAAASLLVVAGTVFLLEALREAPTSSILPAGAGLPASERWFPVFVFRLTQLLARCAVPAGAMWASAAHWGVGLSVGRRPVASAAAKQDLYPVLWPGSGDTPKSAGELASMDERP